MVKKVRRLIEHGIYNANIAWYILGKLDLVFQVMAEKIKTTEQPVDTSCKDKEFLDFKLILDNNYYLNLKSLHIYFLIRFRNLSNEAQVLQMFS